MLARTPAIAALFSFSSLRRNSAATFSVGSNPVSSGAARETIPAAFAVTVPADAPGTYVITVLPGLRASGEMPSPPMACASGRGSTQSENSTHSADIKLFAALCRFIASLPLVLFFHYSPIEQNIQSNLSILNSFGNFPSAAMFNILAFLCLINYNIFVIYAKHHPLITTQKAGAAWTALPSM